MPYAEHTKVPVDRTKAELEKTLQRFGAEGFGTYTERDKAIVVFSTADRRVRFILPLTEANERELRRRWRALLLCIKAKLESVASNIESFEDAFMAHIVLPEGGTVGDKIRPMIVDAYKKGLPPPDDLPRLAKH